jgi:hypothetical protein
VKSTRKKRAKKSQKKTGAPLKQSTVIKLIKSIGEKHGYVISARSASNSRKDGKKEFRPDIIAEHSFRKKMKYIFEVEATISNNTIYKSIVSLLNSLANDGTTAAFLVVPQKGYAFAVDCVNNTKDIIRVFNKKSVGANPKIRLEVITFEKISKQHKKTQKWWDEGRKGQPPKASFLPRPK